jgi:hypothetical protein
VEIFFKTPTGPDLDFPKKPVNTFAPEENQAPGSLLKINGRKEKGWGTRRKWLSTRQSAVSKMPK